MEGSRVVIQKDFCVGCGLCVSDCPSSALRMTDEGPVYAGRCLECGHCVAVCPTNAVAMPQLDMGGVVEYDPRRFQVDPACLLNTMKFRRSVRFYANKPLPLPLLTQLLEAGRHAPTAKNTQATRFVAVQDDLPELKTRFWAAMPRIIEQMQRENSPALAAFERFLHVHDTQEGKDSLFFNAPTMILVLSDNMWDAGLAAGNIELMAAANQLGLLHSGYLKRALPAVPGLCEWLGIEKEKLACVLLCGYPGVRYTRTAPRKPAEFTIR